MPISECDHCGGEVHWRWSEAFEKFGFLDGDGQIETWQVEEVLVAGGYAVTVEQWGCHNLVIVSVKKDGQELIPYEREGFVFGYSEPREWFPDELVTLLDEEFPDP